MHSHDGDNCNLPTKQVTVDAGGAPNPQLDRPNPGSITLKPFPHSSQMLSRFVRSETIHTVDLEPHHHVTSERPKSSMLSELDDTGCAFGYSLRGPAKPKPPVLASHVGAFRHACKPGKLVRCGQSAGKVRQQMPERMTCSHRRIMTACGFAKCYRLLKQDSAKASLRRRLQETWWPSRRTDA